MINIINLKANIIENGHVGPIDEVENLQLDYEEDINLSFKNYTRRKFGHYNHLLQLGHCDS